MAVLAPSFKHANPHALSSIVEASSTRRIVASQDIYDERGVKLWARDQPVSYSLQERLLERKLKHPLEACLRAEDGVTVSELQRALTAYLASDHALAPLVRPFESQLQAQVSRLPLHPAIQLLLTTTQTTKPEVFAHAIQGMALAGALQARVNSEHYDLRLALLGGLLHDVGEMYVNPQHLSESQHLDVRSYRHVVTHPRVGELLLASFTDYPAPLGRAVGEHHERLDGTGYPVRVAANSVSPLGRLLAVVETALGIADRPDALLARISFALRVIPGEYDAGWMSLVAQGASEAQEDVGAALLGVADDPNYLHNKLTQVGLDLIMIQAEAQAMANAPDLSALVKDVASRVFKRIERLRVGGNSIGLWEAAPFDHSPQGLFELSQALDEIDYRLMCVERDCLWPHPDLSEKEAQDLAPLWAMLGR